MTYSWKDVLDKYKEMVAAGHFKCICPSCRAKDKATGSAISTVATNVSPQSATVQPSATSWTYMCGTCKQVSLSTTGPFKGCPLCNITASFEGKVVAASVKKIKSKECPCGISRIDCTYHKEQ